MSVGSRIELVPELWKTSGCVPVLEPGESTVSMGGKKVYNGNKFSFFNQKGEIMKKTAKTGARRTGKPE